MIETLAPRLLISRPIEALVPNYASDMGGYEEILSDQEIWAVLDYIKSQWPEDIRQKQAEITARASGN